ncbi:MAG: hypothetical protein M3O70_00725 [Actinomycetota bacterium]|nr:hypothetical protein [Actinomycetota bacterium]
MSSWARVLLAGAMLAAEREQLGGLKADRVGLGTRERRVWCEVVAGQRGGDPPWRSRRGA